MAAHTPQTKRKIIEAATQLLLDEGFGAASVVAIRAAAGVSNGSFYGAFPTRQTLFVHILGSIEASARPGLSVTISRPAKSGRRALAGILQAHLQWLVENPTLARLRDILTQGLAAEAPATATPASNWEEKLLAAWARPLMAEGIIRPMSAPLLRALVLGTTDAVARHGDAEGAGALVDAMAPVLAEAAWMSIRSPVRPERSELLAAPPKAKPPPAGRTALAGQPGTPDLFAESDLPGYDAGKDRNRKGSR